MKNKEVLLGVLGGVVSGALVGLLLTPEKKPKRLSKFEDRAGGELDALRDKYANMLDRLNLKLDALKEEYEKIPA